MPPTMYQPSNSPIGKDSDKDLEQWHVFPERLPNQRFGGFQNREDQTQLRGMFVVGQNVTLGGGNLPALRSGYEVVGTSESVDATPVSRAWLYETRNGAQWELKAYDTKLAYWLVGTSTDWLPLKTGFTSGLDWGFANIGKTLDSTSHCLFSNGTDGFYKFNGAYTTFDSAAATSGSIAASSFTAPGRVTTINATPVSGGLGFVAGDVLTIQAGNYNCQLRVSTVDAAGTITALTLLQGGSGYSVATNLNISGGHGYQQGGTYAVCTVQITAVSTTGGTGYTVGDVLTVNAGGMNATYSVVTVSGGVVTKVLCTNPGSGYSVASGVAVTGGTGAGFLIDITAIASNWIKKQGTTTWADEGFYSGGTLNIAGVESTYTGAGDSVFLVGVTPDPTLAGTSAGQIIIQSPVVVTQLASVQGNVMSSNDGRLHVRLDTKKSIWDYSMLDNPFDFTAIPAQDGIGGSKEVEFGGPITAFGKINKTMLCFKKRQIKALDFLQSGSRVDSPRYQTLVPADDKGTTLGAVNQKSCFSTPLGMVFMTADNRLMLLTGVTANFEPQYLVLSDPIQPVFSQGVFDEATGICVNNVIYLAFKQDSTSTSNDVVLRGDMTRQSIDSQGRVLPVRWDLPYIGWNVNDWTVIYNPTTAQNEIHWHSSLNSNTYRLISQKSDNTTGYTGIVRTWAEHFDAPANQKRIEEAFVEIRMNENASVLATVLYDEDGFTGRDETTLTTTGTDADHKFGGTVYNPFGASAFGTTKLGSNMSSDTNPTYRFHLEINPIIFFYNVSLQLSVDGEGQDFELIRFGYKLCEIVKDTDRKYLKN